MCVHVCMQVIPPSHTAQGRFLVLFYFYFICSFYFPYFFNAAAAAAGGLEGWNLSRVLNLSMRLEGIFYKGEGLRTSVLVGGYLRNRG